jgi:hypothetical protein
LKFFFVSASVRVRSRLYLHIYIRILAENTLVQITYRQIYMNTYIYTIYRERERRQPQCEGKQSPLLCPNDSVRDDWSASLEPRNLRRSPPHLSFSGLISVTFFFFFFFFLPLGHNYMSLYVLIKLGLINNIHELRSSSYMSWLCRSNLAQVL